MDITKRKHLKEIFITGKADLDDRINQHIVTQAMRKFYLKYVEKISDRKYKFVTQNSRGETRTRFFYLRDV